MAMTMMKKKKDNTKKKLNVKNNARIEKVTMVNKNNTENMKKI